MLAAAPGAAAEVAGEAGARDPSLEDPTPASDAGLWTRETFSGSWGRWRDAFAERGVTFGLSYTGDVWGVVSGGIQRRAEYVSNWDLTLTLDTDPLLGWKGGKLFVYGLGIWRTGSPSAHSGDIQALDNIDAPNQWRLYEAWFEQQMLGSRLSLRAGLYDVSVEFDASRTGSLFLNGSFGTGKDFGQSGIHGPSIFPATSLGVRLDTKPLANAYARVAVLDGVPGSPDSDMEQAFFSFGRDQGVLCVGEAGYVAGEGEGGDPYTKLGLGGWYYSGEFERIGRFDASGEPSQRRGSYGMYLLSERMVYREPQAPNRGLAVVGRVGFADARVNRVVVYAGGAAVYTGPLPARPGDQLGLGVAAAIGGHAFRRATEADGTPFDPAEVAIELTYRAEITPWLHVQPDLQYVINPGLDGRTPNALALALRFELVF